MVPNDTQINRLLSRDLAKNALSYMLDSPSKVPKFPLFLEAFPYKYSG